MTAKAAGKNGHAKSGYELWQDSIDQALKDARWNAYDCDIQRIVGQYNRHLSGTAGYIPLDWKLVKAMVWTESGGPDNRAWRDNPIQIGNPGDPGLAALFSKNEGGELIIPPEQQGRLTIASARATPQMNIAAGVAYLLMRLAKYDFASVPDPSDSRDYEVILKAGDTLDKLSKQNRTTVQTLRNFNPGTSLLRPGQKLKYRKASFKRVIARWTAASTVNIARLYNVGDPSYATKLSYCLSVMGKARKPEAVCER
jgi:hypothetical protein